MNQVAPYEQISHALRSDQTMGRLTLALGLDGSKESMKEARKYASSVLMEIERNLGDPKKDISGCTPNSIVQTMIDAARMRIFIDNRQHAHIIKYGDKATLQIGYRGYIHKIKEHFPDADFSYGSIYEGDEFKVSSENGFDDYNLKVADPFEDRIEKLKGVYVAISYTVNGEPKQKVTTLSIREINKIKKSSKQDYVWNAWFQEKAIVAAIKRACKVNFASIKEISEIAEYDNKTHFKPFNDRKPDVQSDNPFETMNKIKSERENPASKETGPSPSTNTSNISDNLDCNTKDHDNSSDLFDDEDIEGEVINE